MARCECTHRKPPYVGLAIASVKEATSLTSAVSLASPPVRVKQRNAMMARCDSTHGNQIIVWAATHASMGLPERCNVPEHPKQKGAVSVSLRILSFTGLAHCIKNGRGESFRSKEAMPT